jgi:hypothetical protein
MGAACSSMTSVDFQQTAGHYIQEDTTLISPTVRATNPTLGTVVKTTQCCNSKDYSLCLFFGMRTYIFICIHVFEWS